MTVQLALLHGYLDGKTAAYLTLDARRRLLAHRIRETPPPLRMRVLVEFLRGYSHASSCRRSRVLS